MLRTCLYKSLTYPVKERCSWHKIRVSPNSMIPQLAHSLWSTGMPFLSYSRSDGLQKRIIIDNTSVTLTYLLSTHADTQCVDYIVYCLSLFVCTVTDFSSKYKASGVKFCTVVHRRPGQRISHFGELCSCRSSSEAQNRTSRPTRR